MIDGTEEIAVKVELNKGLYLSMRRIEDMKELFRGEIFVDIENYHMVKPECSELVKFYDREGSVHLYDTIQIYPEGLEFSREQNVVEKPGDSNWMSVGLHRVSWKELENAARSKASYKRGKLSIPSYSVKELLKFKSV
jgi:hypothetical protein